jgi:tetratricopeptide (TPR) repeat protein
MPIRPSRRGGSGCEVSCPLSGGSTVGFRYHRSVALGRGVGLSFSASGIGISARTPEPTEQEGSGARPALPRPSRPLFAPRSRKGIFVAGRYRRAFRRGLAELAQGNAGIALVEMERASVKGGAGRASIQLFVAFCLIELERLPEAACALRWVVASDAPLPDQLMRKHLSASVLEVHVTPNITAHTGMDRGGVALLLAEILQHVGRPLEAIDLLETLVARTRSAAVALCLADRYLADEAWDEVERVTDAFTSNVDDLSLQILILRARAQRERGAFIPTLTTLREALRFRKRDPSLLNAARYERALMYEAEGKRALARKDLERIFDHEPDFRDVAQRLSGSPLLLSDYDLELLPSDAG